MTSVPSSCTPRVCLPKRTQFVLLFLFFGHLQKQNFRSKRKKYKIQNRRFMPRGCKSPAAAVFPVLPSPGEASSVLLLRLKIPPSTFRSHTHFPPTSSLTRKHCSRQCVFVRSFQSVEAKNTQISAAARRPEIFQNPSFLKDFGVSNPSLFDSAESPEYLFNFD